MMKHDRAESVEPALARKIAELRHAHGWTYERMAAEMAAVGCPIHPSAIQKSEKTGRRIVVDEILAYSRVFRIPVGTLLDENVEVLQTWRAEEAERIRDLAAELSGRLTAFGVG